MPSNKNCFKIFIAKSKKWTGARRFCKFIHPKGNLVSVDSSQLNSIVASKLVKNNLKCSVCLFWIDGKYGECFTKLFETQS